MFMSRIGCAFGRHVPNRAKVWHDTQDYRAACKGCGKPMLRDHDGWRLVDPEDFAMPRKDGRDRRG